MNVYIFTWLERSRLFWIMYTHSHIYMCTHIWYESHMNVYICTWLYTAARVSVMSHAHDLWHSCIWMWHVVWMWHVHTHHIHVTRAFIWMWHSCTCDIYVCVSVCVCVTCIWYVTWIYASARVIFIWHIYDTWHDIYMIRDMNLCRYVTCSCVDSCHMSYERNMCSCVQSYDMWHVQSYDVSYSTVIWHVTWICTCNTFE